MTLLILVAYLITWNPVDVDDPFVYGIFRTDSIGNYQLIAETADTCYADTLAEHGRTYYYTAVRWLSGDEYGDASRVVSGATLDLSEGDGRMISIYRGMTLLAVYQPHGLWLSSWSAPRPDIEIPEIYQAIYVWDYNRNGILDISDYARFADTDYTAEDKQAFLAMYGHETIKMIHIQ